MKTTNRHPTSESRDGMLCIRVSASERAQLKKLASAVGLSVGAYLLGLALGESAGKAVWELMKKA